MVDTQKSYTVCTAYQRTLETFVVGPPDILDRGTGNQFVIAPGLPAVGAADQKELGRGRYIVVVQLLEGYIDCAVRGHSSVRIIDAVVLRAGDLHVRAPGSPAISRVA